MTGCLAALNHFISHLGERGLSLYHLLKKSDHFFWTEEAQEALDRIKQLLTKAPILVPPMENEPMLRDHDVSRERRGRRRARGKGTHTPGLAPDLLR